MSKGPDPCQHLMQQVLYPSLHWLLRQRCHLLPPAETPVVTVVATPVACMHILCLHLMWLLLMLQDPTGQQRYFPVQTSNQSFNGAPGVRQPC